MELNAAQWILQLHGQLAAFPADYALLGKDKKEVRASDWGDEFTLPDGIGNQDIIDLVWDTLDPARRSS